VFYQCKRKPKAFMQFDTRFALNRKPPKKPGGESSVSMEPFSYCIDFTSLLFAFKLQFTSNRLFTSNSFQSPQTDNESSKATHKQLSALNALQSSIYRLKFHHELIEISYLHA
jgi:hypothetical protein